MPYIGVSPSNGVRRVHTYTATASQTTFSGAGAEGTSLSYKDSNFVDVYQNGIKLGDADYTSTSGTSIVLAQGASVDDLVVVVVFDVFSVADTVSKADGGTFDGNVTMAGTLDVTGAITSSAGATITTADNSVNLNLVSTDADANSGPELELYRNSASPADNDFVGTISFQAENDAGEKIEYGVLKTRIVDASDGTEDFRMTFEGKVGGSDVQFLKMDNSNIVFNEDSQDIDFRIESDANANAFFLEASTGRIGMGTDAMGDYHANRDDLVIATSGSTGITLVAGGSGHQSAIAFADGTGDSEEDAGLLMYNHNGNIMSFNVADGQVAQFSSVNMGIFSTDQTARLNIESNLSAYTCISLKNNNSSNTSGVFQNFLNASGTVVGSISQSGTSTSFNTSSDYRIKENVNYNFDATTELKKLKPCKFNFIGESETIEGFLAHEVSDVVPRAVNGVKDGTLDIGTIKDADGNVLQENAPQERADTENKQTWTKTGTENVIQGLDQAKLVPLLTKTLQEALTRIDTLEAEVKALKGE